MSGASRFAAAAARVYRSSLVGSFVIVVLASALLAATGVLVESGFRGDAPTLLAVASSFASAPGAPPSDGASGATRRAAPPTRAGPASAAAVTSRSADDAPAAAPRVPGTTNGTTTTTSPSAATVHAVTRRAGLISGASVALARTAVVGSTRTTCRAVTRAASTAVGASRATARSAGHGLRVNANPAAKVEPTTSATTITVVPALLNARGHSRRLTAAVVPLALLLALGTVQTSLDATMVRAAQHQLTAGIDADVVVRAPAGLGAEQQARLEEVDGVAAARGTATVPVEAKVDEDDELFSSLELLWEPAALLVVPATVGDVLDPDVTSGSLDGLARPGSVAVSADALLDTFESVGGSVSVRHPDGTEEQLEIVAVFARGVGFGSFLVGEATAAAREAGARLDTVFVRTEPGQTLAVIARLTALGLDAVTTAGHIEDTTQANASQQRLSQALLAVLLAFLLVACVNTLAMLTGQRRRELVLLHRTGMTRRQLLTMGGDESALVAAGALVIGTLAVAPALAVWRVARTARR